MHQWLLRVSGLCGKTLSRYPSTMATFPRWTERAAHTQELIDAALEAASPERAVQHHMSRERAWLRVGSRKYHLPDFSRVLLLGFGKAAAAMANVAESILGDYLSGGLIITHYGHSRPMDGIEIVEAGHPIPDENGVVGAKRMLELVGSPSERDLFVALISGGGSTLLTLPMPGISLSDLQVVNQIMLHSGADIHQLNSVRKHLSQVKGGNLARCLYPAHVVGLMLSDVIGNDDSVIASGPLTPDRSTFTQVCETLDEFNLSAELPRSVRNHLHRGVRGDVAENPAPGGLEFERVQTIIVGDNKLAAHAAVERANDLGFSSRLLTSTLIGEASDAASWIVKQARDARAADGGMGMAICLVAGGETTVKVTGDGKGGRNQEIALAAALEMSMEHDERARLVTLATDGRDGPTDAAGAWVEYDSVERANAAGLDARKYLHNNDAYSFFSVLGDLIITGPTGTNVNDLLFWFWY